MSRKPFRLSAKVVVRDERGRCLLLKRAMSSKGNPGKWDLPEGRVDAGESFSQALLGEVVEETGLTISVQRVLGTAESESPTMKVMYLILEGRLESGPCYRTAIEDRRKVEGETQQTARLLNLIGSFLRDMRLYQSSSSFITEAATIFERALGPNHPDVAVSLNNRALLYKKERKYDGALPLYQRALKISESTLGPNHPSVAIRLNNLAALYRAQGKCDEALSLCQWAVSITEASLGTTHPNTGILRGNLKACEKAMRRR